MKSVLIIVFSYLSILPMHAQKIIEKTFAYKPTQRVNLNLTYADDIRLYSWNKPEVYVKISTQINGGRSNDALLIDFNTSPEAISVKVDMDWQILKQGRREDCPAEIGNMQWGNSREGYYACVDVFYEIYLPNEAELNVETINGNIEIKDFSGPVFAKSISGVVDMSWPKGKGADVVMQSFNGTLYSDPGIVSRGKEEKPRSSDNSFKGKINGGGYNLRLESISNNVYLRSQ
jgi:hypothetical protein